MFADDLKLYRQITKHNDIELIQQDLNRIENWCILNHMKLNVQKCCHIRFTRKKHSGTASYTINGTTLDSVNEVRDLGVFMDSKLTFTRHIDNIVTKSARMLGFLKRNTKGFKHCSTKIILYNTLVRSHLEFASVVWNPHYAIHSQRIEQLQRAFTRHLAYTSNKITPRCPYNQRIECFEMQTLRHRRLVYDIMFLYKIVNNKLDCENLSARVAINVPYNMPRRPITNVFHVEFSKTNIGVNSSINRICREYNAAVGTMPDMDIFHDSIDNFKSKLLESLEQPS